VGRLREEWRRLRSSSLAQNAGWMFLGQGFSVFSQGAYFILLARLLGATEYGIYAGVVSMVAILSQYSALGSHSVYLRYVTPDPRNFAPYWGNVLVTIGGIGSLLVGLLAWGGPHWATAYSWSMVLCVALGDCLCAQITLSAGRVFQASENLRVTALLNLLVNQLRMVLAGLILFFARHAMVQQWVVVELLVSSVSTFTALILVTRTYGKPAFSSALMRRRAGEGLVFALSYSTTGIYNDVDKAMLGHFGMNAANGVYAMAYRVINVACMPFISLQAAAFPRFFQKGVDGIGSTGQFAVRLVKRTVPIALFSTAIMLVAAPTIPHLVGKSFSESVSALRWLCLLPVFRSLHASAGDALTGAGHQKLRLGSQATAAAFNFTTNLYLIPHYGWLGAAWASLATDGLLAVFNWAVLWWLTLKTGVSGPIIAERVG
jgi:O-antigen/teichoic acid export membrane protein